MSVDDKPAAIEDESPQADSGEELEEVVDPEDPLPTERLPVTQELLETSWKENRQDIKLGLTGLSRHAGVYGVFGDDVAWNDLGLGEVQGDGLLYVGLTLDGLNSRVVDTHFANRKTPWSIVRRTLASVLKDELSLETTDPVGTGRRHFGLVPKSDRALSKWMRNHLEVGTWIAADLEDLQAAEKLLLAEREPVLSPYHAPADVKARLESARLAMAGLDVGETFSEGPTNDQAPAPLRALLDALSEGTPVLSLAHQKPTWVVAQDNQTIRLQVEPPETAMVRTNTLAVDSLVEAYETLLAQGHLEREDLTGSAKRRSAFVLALLAGLDGVDFTVGPVRLSMVTD